MNHLKSLLLGAAALCCATTFAAETWGEWEDYATGTFDAQYWYRKPMENLKVQRRVSSSNESRVQYKVCGMFGDTPGCPPIDLIINANFAVQGPTASDVSIWVDDQYIESYDIGGKKTDIYLCDGYTYYDNYFPTDPGYAMQYEDASYFRPETGTFTIYSYYHYADGTVPFLDAFYQDQAQGVETLRLFGPDFKNYTPDFGSGHFEQTDNGTVYACNISLNDLSQIKAVIVPGTVSDVRNIANQMNNGTIDHSTITESGTALIPFDGIEGANTLVYLTYKADKTPYQFAKIDLTYDPNWRQLGKATFTDGFISKFLEGDMTQNLGLSFNENDFTYPVDIEESINTPGRYRLVNPYGETSPYWNINFSNVNIDKKRTGYLYINATDPERVHIEYSECGFYYGSYPLVLYSEGHDWIAEGYDPDNVPENLWGKLSDGIITFGEGSEDDNLLSAKILTSPAPIYGRQLVVKLPDSSVDAIGSDISASDEPAQYFNLQGIRVAEPQRGQIYIVRQGDNVKKIVL